MRLLSIHPATILSLWVLVVLMITGNGLAIDGIAAICVLAIGIFCAPDQLKAMFRRTRWLLLAAFLSFALTTPGELVPALPVFTVEGLWDGLDQVLALVIMMGLVVLLLRMLDMTALIQAVYALLRPYELLGGSRTRVATRLVLTIETLRQKIGMENMAVSDVPRLAAVPDKGPNPESAALTTLTLPVTGFSLGDLLALGLGLAVFAGRQLMPRVL